MRFVNKNITIEKVEGKPYCKVEDHAHIYFIPEHLCQQVEDYVHRATFENHELNSLQQWYLSLPMDVKTLVIIVLNQKIA